MRRSTPLCGLLASLVLGCSSGPKPAPPELRLVGSARCQQCHASEAAAWRTSDHFEAMREATPQTVQGDFNDAHYEYFGFRSRFFRRGAEFWVETDGPAGLKTEYRIDYTFGHWPLQQYLIRFPDGRLQALGLAWDSQKRRWFHLHPEEPVTFRSSLHWTGPQSNWDFMCAECHSTGLERKYDPQSGQYATRYHEINVACEACHGPGSRHVADPTQGGFPTRLDGRGPWKPGRPPRPAHPEKASGQVETCARCHSRRTVIAEPYVAGQDLNQTRAVEVLGPGLYHADGQIQDEVYVYGSFVQSKMYHAGVVCTDCHDPHTARVKQKGDALCLQCHVPDSHSHHREVRCIECHMPGQFYMVVDYRRDHSFRIPRPDLSVELGTPNACTACHQQKTAAWAAEHFRKYYGEQPPHYGQVLAAGRRGEPGAVQRLAALAADPSQPEIVRATAVSLAPVPEVLGPALKAPGALIRREAVRALGTAEPQVRQRLLEPLAADPVRSVRVEVGRALAGLPVESASGQAAVAEYRASLLAQQERAEAHLGLAQLHLAEGEPRAAEESLKTAVKLAPLSPEPYVNLADLYRATGRDQQGKQVLQEALARLDRVESAPVHYALGLLLVRERQLSQAVEHLRAASQAGPEPSWALTLALALEAQGHRTAAVAELKRALLRHPHDRELRSALEALSRPRKP